MAATTLVRRLMKEIERGGKKSALLGVLMLGGMFFWIPMLWKAIAPPRASESKSATTTTPPPRDPEPRDDAPTHATAVVDWKSLHRRLNDSQVVQPLALEELVRDPFDQAWIREKMQPAATSRTESAVAPVADPLPTMALSAVVVGSDGGAAVINNEVYRIGDHVPPHGAVRYVLKRILSDKVVLEREGNSFELAFRTKEKKDQ